MVLPAIFRKNQRDLRVSERQHLPIRCIFDRHAAIRHYREGMLHLRVFVRGERREESPNRHPAGDGLEAGLMVVVRMGGDDPIQPRHAEGFQRGLNGGFLRVSARVNHPGVAVADENGGVGEGHLGKSDGEDGCVGRKRASASWARRSRTGTSASAADEKIRRIRRIEINLRVTFSPS